MYTIIVNGILKIISLRLSAIELQFIQISDSPNKRKCLIHRKKNWVRITKTIRWKMMFYQRSNQTSWTCRRNQSQSHTQISNRKLFEVIFSKEEQQQQFICYFSFIRDFFRHYYCFSLIVATVKKYSISKSFRMFYVWFW